MTFADYPGNVRQLRDIVETAARHSTFGEVTLDHLTTVHWPEAPLSQLEEAELQQIREALAEAGGTGCGPRRSCRSGGRRCIEG
ncbi:hypothetical protein NIIDNTM18_53860 [Mycolicibacterium litorale]|uniref:Uncharacterized protein n=1 Tax=Mycolicibacterium litorale TaxID=758802 RepID=A0A6S6PJH9_9MYCO|nr:hypothetical protein [Mycolicibacterium litorale]BCI56108.1 hypothetical protein NIIDNTM18_53860 [Mycolicibacterium litorale]